MGRGKEMQKLKEILWHYGSAAITGIGGLGKSQLMAAFAERAEVDGEVPGDVFWVVADGDASQLVESFAVLAEKLQGSMISDHERQNPKVVLSILRNMLSKTSGRFLLCLDNVDNASDPEVAEILDELYAVLDPTKSNGWEIVKSRSGMPRLWESMNLELNIVLAPLSVGDAIDVLWRYKESIQSRHASDEEIAEAVAL